MMPKLKIPKIAAAPSRVHALKLTSATRLNSKRELKRLTANARHAKAARLLTKRRAAIAAELAMTRRPLGIVQASIAIPERFYGDGPPHWEQGRNDEPCETSIEAEYERQRTIKHLRWHEADDALYGQLARLIERCRKKLRCQSGACPLCRRALQRWFVWTAPTATKKHGGDRKGLWVRISVISKHRIRGGRDRLHMRRLIRAAIDDLTKGVANASITIAIGGIDISFNQHATDAFQGHYQIHVWCLVPYTMGQQARPPLEAEFPSNPVVKHPTYVGLKPYDGSPRGFGYAVKTEFKQRNTLPKEMTPEGRRPSQNTREKNLTVAQRLPLLVMLHMLGLEGRLFLIGAAVKSNSESDPIIRAV